MSGDPSKLCRNCLRPQGAHGPADRPDARCQRYEPLGWAGVAREQARGRFPVSR